MKKQQREKNMEKKDRDYSIYIAIITIWIMIGGLAQCDSASHLEGIRQELNDIKHELNLMRYK